MTNVSEETLEELRKRYGPGRKVQPSSLTRTLDFSKHEASQLGRRLNNLQTFSIFVAVFLAVALLFTSVTWYVGLGAVLILYLAMIHVGKRVLRERSRKTLARYIDEQS